MPDTVDWLAEARKIASKVRRIRPGVDRDDALGAAGVAVARLLSDFDSSRGESALAHVRSLGLERAIDELRTDGLPVDRTMRRPGQNWPVIVSGGNMGGAADAPTPQASRYELFDHPSLTTRESRVLRLHYQEGLTFEIVGEIIGVSLGTVSNTHASAISKLRAAFGRSP